MKKIFVLLLTLFIGFNLCFGQNIDTTYFDKNWNSTASKNYKYYRVAKRDSDFIKVTDYERNGDIQMTGGYKTFEFENETGPFYYYKNNLLTGFELYEPSRYPKIYSSLNEIVKRIPQQPDSLILDINYFKDQTIKSIGYRHKCCDLIGTWFYFSKNGKYVTEESYKNNVGDGSSTVYFLNKIIISGNWKDGKKDGEWIFRFYDGQLRKTEVYQDGQKIKVIRPKK